MSKSPLNVNAMSFGDLLQGQINQSFKTQSEPTVPPATQTTPVVDVPVEKYGKKLTLRIYNEYGSILEELAYKRKISINAIINEAIGEYLKRQ